MGWSCSRKAIAVVDRWKDVCYAMSGSTNQWKQESGRYFYEISNKEHDDGAITGAIWKFLADGVHVRRSNSFRINGDGTIARAPKFLRTIT